MSDLDLLTISAPKGTHVYLERGDECGGLSVWWVCLGEREPGDEICYLAAYPSQAKALDACQRFGWKVLRAP
jgi:hypothetical protein